MNPKLLMAAALLATGSLYQPQRNITATKQKKCLRKECNNTTTHNGGYCSAECCKQDKQKK